MGVVCPEVGVAKKFSANEEWCNVEIKLPKSTDTR